MADVIVQVRATHFRESFIDDGDVDMLEALRVYKEVGYDGLVVPDHVPHLPVDPSNWGTLGYYMKGMLRAID